MGKFALIISLILVIGLVTLGSIAWKVATNQRIATFADCSKRYPVMESYPPQCQTPDGRVFVGPEG